MRSSISANVDSTALGISEPPTGSSVNSRCAYRVRGIRSTCSTSEQKVTNISSTMLRSFLSFESSSTMPLTVSLRMVIAGFLPRISLPIEGDTSRQKVINRRLPELEKPLPAKGLFIA